MVLLRVETALPGPCVTSPVRRLLHRNRLVMQEHLPLDQGKGVPLTTTILLLTNSDYICYLADSIRAIITRGYLPHRYEITAN